MIKKLSHIFLGAAILFSATPSLANAGTTQYTHSFSDVTKDNRFYDDIMHLSKGYVFGTGWNIINGYEDGTFKPTKTITRGEAPAILVRASGVSFVYSRPTFPDIGNSKLWQMIATAEEHQLISGYPDGKFRPNNPITRGEMAIIINRILKLDSHPQDNEMNKWAARYAAFHQKDATMLAKPFADVGRKSASYPAITNLRAFDISGGYPGNEYKPGKLVTRGETAALVRRGLTNAMTITESNLTGHWKQGNGEIIESRIRKEQACKINVPEISTIDTIENPAETSSRRYSEGSEQWTGIQAELCDNIQSYHVKTNEI